MVNVGDLAKRFERKILETPNTEFAVSGPLPKSSAERLAHEYLNDYNPRIDPLNDTPFSSYIVAAPGMKDENDPSYKIVEDVLNKVEKTPLSSLDYRVPEGDPNKVVNEVKNRGYKAWGPTENNVISVLKNGGIKNA